MLSLSSMYPTGLFLTYNLLFQGNASICVKTDEQKQQPQRVQAMMQRKTETERHKSKAKRTKAKSTQNAIENILLCEQQAEGINGNKKLKVTSHTVRNAINMYESVAISRNRGQVKRKKIRTK